MYERTPAWLGESRIHHTEGRGIALAETWTCWALLVVYIQSRVEFRPELAQLLCLGHERFDLLSPLLRTLFRLLSQLHCLLIHLPPASACLLAIPALLDASLSKPSYLRILLVLRMQELEKLRKGRLCLPITSPVVK